jgi:hypothetical protein
LTRNSGTQNPSPWANGNTHANTEHQQNRMACFLIQPAGRL